MEATSVPSRRRKSSRFSRLFASKSTQTKSNIPMQARAISSAKSTLAQNAVPPQRPVRRDDKVWEQMRSKGLVLKGQPATQGKQESRQSSSDLLIESDLPASQSSYSPHFLSPFLSNSHSSLALSQRSFPRDRPARSQFRQQYNTPRPSSFASSPSFPHSPQCDITLSSQEDLTSTAETTPMPTPLAERSQSEVGLGLGFDQEEDSTEPVDMLWAHLETQLGHGLQPSGRSTFASRPPMRPSKSRRRYSLAPSETSVTRQRSQRLDSQVALAQRLLREDRSSDEDELDLVVGKASLNDDKLAIADEEANQIVKAELEKKKNFIFEHGTPKSDQARFDSQVLSKSGNNWNASYIPALDLVLDWSDANLTCTPIKQKPTRRVFSTPPSSIPSSIPRSQLPRSTSTTDSFIPRGPLAFKSAEANRRVSESPSIATSVSSRWSRDSSFVASPASCAESKLPRATPKPSIPSALASPSPVTIPQHSKNSSISSWFGFKR